MIAAIAGDIIGLVHERTRTKCTDFPTLPSGQPLHRRHVMTLAVTGTIAQAHYRKVPPVLVARVEALLGPELWALTRAF
jgi:hypothetical protein